MHIKYIEREGVEKDGSQGHLYGADSSFDRDHFLRDIDGEPHQFRFILSPEDGDKLELTEYTRKFMDQMQNDVGVKLEWAAVNHYNTDNPHTHIVVRGIDDLGKTVRIDRQYMSHGMRNRACELATKELGLRSEKEILQQKNQEVMQERFTQLDRVIHKGVMSDIFNVDHVEHRLDDKDKKFVIGRLQHLEKMGMATRHDNRSWRLHEGWDQTLKQMGQRGDIIKEMHRQLNGDVGSYRIFEKTPDQDGVTGRISHKGLADELYDKYYMTVDAVDGKSYYIELDKFTKHEHLKPGHIVFVEMQRSERKRSMDEIIDALASEHNGIVDQSKIKDYVAEKLNSNLDYTMLIEKRIASLQKMGLANQVEKNEWMIVDNVQKRIEQLDKNSPIHHFTVSLLDNDKVSQQITRKGSSWLDQFIGNTQDGIQNIGFGKDLKQAIKSRIEKLNSWNVNPHSPNRRQLLQEFERIELGREEARNSQSHHEENTTGNTVSGKVEKHIEGRSGAKFVKLTLDNGNSFSLIPHEKFMDKHIGKNVTVTRGQEGKLIMKQRGKDIGGA